MKRRNYFILPVLNRKTSLGGLSSLDLGNRAFIKPVEKSHFGAILEAAPEQYKDSVGPKTKCIYIECEADDLKETQLRIYDTLFRFLFNFHSAENPMFFSFGLLSTEYRTFTVKARRIFVQGTERFDLSSVPYSLRAGTAPNRLKAYHTVIARSILKDKKTLLILQRLNLFLSKEDLSDQIVDLTIALEALIPGTTELIYRFSLYLAFIAEKNPNLRSDVFEIFKKIYEMRSAIVHGSEAKTSVRDFVQVNMTAIKRHALQAVNYYLFYLATKDENTEPWETHLNRLVIAGAQRLYSETEVGE